MNNSVSDKKPHFISKIMKTALCVLLAGFLLPALTGCQSVFLLLSAIGSVNSGSLSQISADLQVDVKNGSVVSAWDNHGGFHGDGTSYTEIHFSDTACLEEIKASPEWKPFPLTENLTILVYGLETEEGACGPFITDNRMNSDQYSMSLIPEITNGYYCFIDRDSESTDEKDDTEIFGRYSYNFTLAVYDADTDILYYVEYDT